MAPRRTSGLRAALALIILLPMSAPADEKEDLEDRIETVTVDSVLAWLEQARLASKPVVFSVKF